MESDIKTYKKTLKKVPFKNVKKYFNNLRNNFIDFSSQFNRLFLIYNDNAESIFNRIDEIKFAQKELILIILRNSLFREFIDRHEFVKNEQKIRFEKDGESDKVWVRPKPERSRDNCIYNAVRDTTVSKILKTVLSIVKDHLNLVNDGGSVANNLFQIIEDSLKDLRQPTVSRSNDLSFMGNVSEIKGFLYNMLGTSVYDQRVLELSLLMYAKLGGVDSFLEWLDSIIPNISINETFIRTEILNFVLQCLFLNNGLPIVEINGHISDCLSIDIAEKEDLTLEQTIEVILSAVIRMCKIENNYDCKNIQVKLDQDRNPFSDIYIWNFGTEIDHIKSAYPDSLSTRLSSSSEKPSNKQVICSQKKLIMINNYGQVRSRSILKGGLNENQFKKTLSQSWSPIQFPDLSIKIDKICVGFASENEKQHILSLSRSGQVFSWGGGNYGKLGHGNTEDVKYPNLIIALRGYVVKEISVGINHSAAVTETGLSFIWGNGLSFNYFESDQCMIPKRLKQGIMSNISCGPSCTYLLNINKRDITYMGTLTQELIPFHLNITLPVHPIPIKWMACDDNKKLNDSSFEKINKILSNSTGLLVLLMNGQLYSLGHGLVLGCPDCEKHESFERAKSMLDVYVLDIALSETHVVILAKNVIYSWTILSHTLTIFEESLSQSISNVEATYLLQSNKQINIAWSKKEESQARSHVPKKQNPYLHSIAIMDSIKCIKSILTKSFEEYEQTSFSRRVVQNTLELLIYLLKSEQTKEIYFESLEYGDSEDLLELLVRIFDKINSLIEKDDLIKDALLLTVNTFYPYSEERAKCLMKILSQRKSLYILGCGERLLLETLILSFDDNKITGSYNGLYQLNLMTLDQVLITICRVVSSDMPMLAQDYLHDDLCKVPRESSFVSLSNVMNRFSTFGYRIYLQRIQSYYPNSHNPITNLCFLLPMINSVISCFKSCLYRNNKTNKLFQLIMTAETKSLNSYFSQTLMGWILFDVIYFLLDDKFAEDLCSLIPHLTSMILSLNEINSMIPNIMSWEAQEVHFPLYGFSTEMLFFHESVTDWTWVVEIQRMSGFLYGKLLNKIVKSIDVQDDERMSSSLENVLFKDIAQFDQQRKSNEQKECLRKKDYEKVLKCLLLSDPYNYNWWSKDNTLYSVGLHIYSVITDLIIVKWSHIDVQLILKFEGVVYIFAKLMKSIEDSIKKIRKNTDILNEYLSTDGDESLLIKYTASLKERCSSLKYLVNVPIINCEHSPLTCHDIIYSDVIEALDLASKGIKTQKKFKTKHIKSHEKINQDYSEFQLTWKMECLKWLQEIYPTLRDLLSVDVSLLLKEELQKLSYMVRVKRTKSSRASVAVQSIQKLLQGPHTLLDSVFGCIMNGLLEPLEILQSSKTFSDDQLYVIDTMFKAVFQKLKMYTELNSYTAIPHRICASILCYMCQYNFRQSNFIQSLVERNICGVILKLVSGRAFITTKKWLIIEGNGDDNLLNVCNLVAWYALEGILLNISLSKMDISLTVRIEMENQIITLLEDIYKEISNDVYLRIFDLQMLLNLCKLLYQKSNFFHKVVSENGLVNLLIQISTMEKHDDILNTFYSKYAVHVSAMDLLSLLIHDLKTIESSHVINEMFVHILGKCCTFYSYLSNRVIELDTHDTISTIECRMESVKYLRSEECMKASIHKWINGNGNFDKKRSFHCDMLSSDKILVNDKGLNTFLALNLENLTRGIWQVTFDISCSNIPLELSCGFKINNEVEWPSDYDSLLTLKQVFQPITVSDQGSLTNRIDCVIDIDECLVYVYNVYNRVHSFPAGGKSYRFFVSFSLQSQHGIGSFEINIVNVRELHNSPMKNINDFYNNSTICHDNYIARTGLYNLMTEFSAGQPDLVFKHIIPHLIGQLKDCTHVDLFCDRKITNPNMSTELIFSLHLLCGISKQHYFYRGEKCTFLLPLDSSEHVGIIIDFKTNQKSRFSGLNFVDKLTDHNDISCTIHSLTTNMVYEIPIKYLIKDEIYGESILSIYFKHVFPHHVEDMVTLLSNLSKCISQHFYNVEVTNYDDRPWNSEGSEIVVAEYHFVKCLATDIFLQIIENEKFLEYFSVLRDEQLEKEFRIIFQNIITFSCKPSPIKYVSHPEKFICCSLRLFEGFKMIQAEVELGLAKKYAKLFLQSHQYMDLGVYLCKKEKNVLVQALKRAGYSKELIKSFTDQSESQTLSSMEGGSVTFNQRRRLLDCSVTSDQANVLPVIQVPANEYDSAHSVVTEAHEMNTTETTHSNQNQIYRQSLIQDFFTIQTQKKKASRICPVCNFVLKYDNISLFAHLSEKHSNNCGKSFPHQASEGIDLDGRNHSLGGEIFHCATVTESFYCVCNDYLNKKILNKGLNVQRDFENFVKDHHISNPLVGWSGAIPSEYYHHQNKSQVNIYRPLKRPDVEEVSVLGDNITDERTQCKNVFNAPESESIQNSDRNVCDEVPFICQINSNAIVKSLIRLENSNMVLCSRRIILNLIKFIYKNNLKSEVVTMLQRFWLTDMTFVCVMIRLVEYGRIHLNESRNIRKDIQTFKFRKEDFITTLMIGLESNLDSSDKIHHFCQRVLRLTEDRLTSTPEYFGLSRDSDKTLFICPSRFLTHILINSLIRILKKITHKKITYEYWQEDIESIIEIFAFGAINEICNVTEKIWCTNIIMAVFNLIKETARTIEESDLNQVDLFDDLLIEESKVVHISNVNVKILLSTNNKQNIITADDQGTLRIWDIDSNITLSQHLQQTLVFSLGEFIDIDDVEEKESCESFNNVDILFPMKDKVSDYLAKINVQNIAVSFNGIYIAESVGLVLNIWSTKSVYCHPNVVRFDSIIKSLVFPELIFQGMYGAPADQLLVGLEDGRVLLLRIFDNGSRIIQRNIKVPVEIEASISTTAWNNERNRIVVGYDDGTMILTDQHVDCEVIVLESIHNKRVSSLLYSADHSDFGQNLLASSSIHETKVGIWNRERLMCVISLSDFVTCVTWLSQTFLECKEVFIIITGNSKGVVQFWQFNNCGKDVKNIINVCGHTADVTMLRINEDTGLLISACVNGLVNIWSVKDGCLLNTFRGSAAIVGAEWTLSNNLVVAWSKDKYIKTFYHFNDLAFTKSGLRQWALVRKVLLERAAGVKSVKGFNNLKMLVLSINKIITEQYNDEEAFIRCGYSIVFSQYLQSVVKLAFMLGLLPTFIPCTNSSIIYNKPFHRTLTFTNISQRRTLCHIFNRNHQFTRSSDINLDWMFDFDQLLQTTEAICFKSNFLKDIVPLWWWNWCFESNTFVNSYKEAKWGNSNWSWDMQTELFQWFCDLPGNWIENYNNSTFVWGCGKKGELNLMTTKDYERPYEVALEGLQQIICGNGVTLAINNVGMLLACGEGLEIVHSPYMKEELSKFIVVPLLSDIKISQVSASKGPESHIIAITSYGDVYSWGIGTHGKLGHGHDVTIKKPKLIEVLRGKRAVQCDCGHMHSAVVTYSGKLYTFGLGNLGQLGVQNLAVSDIPRLVNFKDEDVKVGFVACGLSHTLALSQCGSYLYSFGDGTCGKLGLGDVNNRTIPTSVNLDKKRLLKVVCGDHFSAALIETGDILCWGHNDFLGLEEPKFDITTNNYISVPSLNIYLLTKGVTVSDISAGNDVMFVISSTGKIYGWGSNSDNLLLDCSRTHIYLPELIDIDRKSNFKQISCGRHHSCASSFSPHSFRHDIPNGPQLIHNASVNLDMSHYPALSKSGLNKFDLTARLVLILYWNELVRLTWQMWLPLSFRCDLMFDPSSTSWPLLDPQLYLFGDDIIPTALNHFKRGLLRSLLIKDSVNSDLYRYISGSMVTSRTYGSLVKINRIELSESVFVQTSAQVLKMHALELRQPWRAWKVKLMHEGADDAGGAYDETISEMCSELQSSDNEIGLLVPSPNNNTAYLPNPDPNVPGPYFQFLGILMGTAIRTKKPIDLNMDPLFWKLMTKSEIYVSDLRNLDPAYFNSLLSLSDVQNLPESFLKEVFAVDTFTVFSVNKSECEIMYKGCERDVNGSNLPSYINHALYFRLHELDRCVESIRRGFEGVCPLLLLTVLTWDQVEKAVCGSRTISVSVLKSIARYGDVDKNNEIFKWFWDIVERFSETEKSLLLRFVTGKSRLPSENSKIPFRLFIFLTKSPVTSLPQAQTCFNQIRLPRYTSESDLEDRLRIAISQCRSIDMDDYMLNVV